MFGVAELVAYLVQAQLGIEQEPVGGVAAGLVDESSEGGAFGGQSALQRFGVQSELAGGHLGGEVSGREQLADDAAHGARKAAGGVAKGGG